MPPSPPKAGSPSAMEAFHATFQGALNDEFEALVRDLRAAAGAVADAADSSGASVDPDAWLSKRALVGELVARWTFLIATYRAHVAAEDEVVLPAVAARVSNVAHAYELEHDAEDELFESITAALDDANRSAETLCATATSGEPSSEHVGAREVRGRCGREGRAGWRAESASVDDAGDSAVVGHARSGGGVSAREVDAARDYAARGADEQWEDVRRDAAVEAGGEWGVLRAVEVAGVGDFREYE